ncbi:MAG TPA: hypothetical protein VGW12_20435 [Pyrinomonadaceae bacterium]|nr:hypothetical protein [Pyrinomonadaceae bacterium]
MNEAEYIEKLSASWPRGAGVWASNRLLDLTDEAVQAFPESAKLWVMRGDLIQLGTGETAHTLEDALACYERAVLIDPNFVEGWEEIGHFYDAVMDEEERAREAFQQARVLKDTHV